MSNKFKNDILETTLNRFPEAGTRWKQADEAEKRATEAVREGIRTACEISVALAPSRTEAERMIGEAETVLGDGNRSEMGRHLATAMTELDRTVCHEMSNGWTDKTKETRKLVQEELGKLCDKLDIAALDPHLRTHCDDARRELFPNVVSSEWRRGSARGQLSYVGPKGVSDHMKSMHGRRGDGGFGEDGGSDEIATKAPCETKPLGRTVPIPAGLGGAGRGGVA